MQVCVITDDRMIQIDGEAINFDFTIDANIHAIEWLGSTGNVQFKDNTPNEELTAITAYQSLVDAFFTEKQRLENIAVQNANDAEAAVTYADRRKVKYDALNQFELQFDDAANSTTTWLDAINAIKAEFPKP
jgi:hypothetical protein